MYTGENTQGLRRIADMTRGMAVFVLLLHFYEQGYPLLHSWGVYTVWTDQLIEMIQQTGFFDRRLYALGLAGLLLLVALMGVKGKKDEHADKTHIVFVLYAGSFLYFGSGSFMAFQVHRPLGLLLYLLSVMLGFLMLMWGMIRLSRLLHELWDGDVFNLENQTFPQQESRISNAHSLHFPARYQLKNRIRKSWINIINPFRGLLIMGTPGSGKTYFIIQRVIRQQIAKGSAMLVYDFKAPDLSRIAYSAWKGKYTTHHPGGCYFIRFDDLQHSHRCNPLHPRYLEHISDAAESARAMLLGLNREWIPRQGAFFVESPINFFTAVIWFLRRYEGGRYCTLPHALELMQTDYEALFTVLNADDQLALLINPFINAYRNDAMEQLEGQLASAKIALSRLASPEIYYVLSGDDFTLDINNPQAPKLVCMGNTSRRMETYGAVISLYINRLIQCVNQKGKCKSALVFDEFPTLYLKVVDALLATARENKVAVTLGFQDISQLRRAYGREQAEVIMNVAGNVISGQVSGDGARWMSERIGRILQERRSISVNRSDTSFNRSRVMEPALPPSRIAAMSSGEFAGALADQPRQPQRLKVFHSQIQAPRTKMKLLEIPQVRRLQPGEVDRQFLQIRSSVKQLVENELRRLKM